MESNCNKLESENRKLAALVDSCKQRIEESADKIKILQENLKETATDEISSLMRQLEKSVTELVGTTDPVLSITNLPKPS